jgi:hypothetical protein
MFKMIHEGLMLSTVIAVVPGGGIAMCPGGFHPQPTG